MASVEICRLQNRTLCEEVFHGVVPSGLEVFFCPKAGFQKKYVCYSTHFGSVDNEFIDEYGVRVRVPDGLAHFLEHTLFETEAGNVSDLFALNGAYSNAATSFTVTTYLFAASERFYDNLKLLIDFVENPSFRADRVEKERGIIEEEIRGSDDDPDWVSDRGLLENLFSSHPMRIDIAGTVESVRAIDVSTLESCYRRFYHPRNMCLFVIGDLERDALFDFVSAHSRPRAGEGPPRERCYPQEPAQVACREAAKRMEVSMPKLLVGFKEVGVPASGKDLVVHELASQMALDMLFGRSSDCFLELYCRQLVLDDFCAFYYPAAGIGYTSIGGDTPRPDELKTVLLARIDALRSGGLSEVDFQRGKRKFVGGFLRGFNSLEFIANHYTYYRLCGFDLFQIIDLLGEVSRELLEDRVRKLLDPERCASFVVLPGGDGAGANGDS
jgi:predicted Zn-dependent peptidase